MVSSKTDFFTCFEPPHSLKLESSKYLGPITLAYETYGKLSKERDNAILICHPLSCDAHVTGKKKDSSKKKGWWHHYVGPNKAIDTNKFFVICSNSIASCHGSTGPSSINPKTNKPYGIDFPVVTIGDMIKPQKKLIDYFNIKCLKAVIGGSMGGMQAIEWSIQYPESLKMCIPIAATAKLSPQALAFDAVGRHAITGDPNWKNGNYGNKKPEKGLSIARMIGHITYVSEDILSKKFGRNLQKRSNYGYDLSTDFQIESYLNYKGDSFGASFDANSYIYLTKAINYFDLTKKYGSLEQAFQNVSTKFLVITISSDWLYTPNQSKEFVKSLMRLNKDVSYIRLDSQHGHDGFLLEDNTLKKALYSVLNYSK